MAYIDYTDCVKCEGQMEISMNSTLEEGTIKCTNCGFESTLTRGAWIIDETGEELNYP